MICNNCGYSHNHPEYNDKTGGTDYKEGIYGEFYRLPIEMKRSGWGISEIKVYGCPHCGNIQMDV